MSTPEIRRSTNDKPVAKSPDHWKDFSKGKIEAAISKANLIRDKNKPDAQLNEFTKQEIKNNPQDVNLISFTTPKTIKKSEHEKNLENQKTTPPSSCEHPDGTSLAEIGLHILSTIKSFTKREQSRADSLENSRENKMMREITNQNQGPRVSMDGMRMRERSLPREAVPAGRVSP